MILNESEVKCDQCNGEGTIQHGIICKKCWGEGKLDWVSNVMRSNDIFTWAQQPLKMCEFKGVITINNIEGVSGTAFPIGTISNPVNNIHDAKIIAKERGYGIK
jgi:RecJ-like exonuclease